LSSYDSEILTRERSLADFFEQAVKTGEKLGIKPKIIANYIINKKVETKNIVPADLIKQISSATQVSRVDDDKLNEVIDKVMNENEKAVLDYKNGKETVIMFLVGQVMRQFPSRIDAEKIKASLLAKLK